jgi:hypothetical protein
MTMLPGLGLRHRQTALPDGRVTCVGTLPALHVSAAGGFRHRQTVLPDRLTTCVGTLPGAQAREVGGAGSAPAAGLALIGTAASPVGGARGTVSSTAGDNWTSSVVLRPTLITMFG